MRRIATFVLMMLIGGYGAAHADDEEGAGMTTEEAAEETAATNDFLGLKWGAGIGVLGGFGGDKAVEKASIDANKIVRVDEEADLRPQLFLEMHVFLKSNPFKKSTEDKVNIWRAYQEKKTGDPPPAPLTGFGPFIALQSSDKTAIDALSVGIMWGFRKDPDQSASLNIGLGLSFDPSVQVLGDGIKEGKPLPEGETVVRFKKEGRFGWALMASFAF
jgi:hypothetical protein